MFIYLVLNLINGKKYIGQTTNTIAQRWIEHCKPSRYNSQLISRAIKKYGKKNFEIKQLAKVESTDGIEWLNILEPLFIKAHNSLHPDGYNLDGGGKNKVMHQDTKDRIGKANKGKLLGTKRPIAVVEKTAASNKGKKRSAETRTNISNALLGKTRAPLSQEHKDKIGDGVRGEQNGMFGVPPWNKGLKLGPYSPERRHNIGEANRNRVSRNKKNAHQTNS